MPQIKEICRYLEEWAPKAYAESYDNVGLLVGDREEQVKGVLVSLDCIEDVVDEAIENECNLIVSHHPIIFKGLKKITGQNYVERTVLKAIKNGIALYAIHTNLDSVMTGVNAKIAERMGLRNLSILSPKKESLNKLIVFVPSSDSEKLREALFCAGAGEIGNYSNCSFNLEGKGTFHPNEGANPTIGKIGGTQYENETRIEVMFPSYLSGTVLHAMKKAHPYEEVAYYLQSLENHNQYVGSGMVGDLPEELSSEQFLEKLKRSMELKSIRYTQTHNANIKKVAICGGSGSFLLSQAKSQKADAFVTGDFKYHEFFDSEGEIMIADIGHYESERFTVPLIGDYLRKKFTTFAIRLTEVNTNPIHYF
ncbi:MAG: Nif3-like dinuclear metal center hexameric protein [Flavobacteriales bacterium]|nr:Nif3-like dinuclear metal center hexameric protein [Flavobacteriales bacterium]